MIRDASNLVLAIQARALFRQKRPKLFQILLIETSNGETVIPASDAGIVQIATALGAEAAALAWRGFVILQRRGGCELHAFFRDGVEAEEKRASNFATPCALACSDLSSVS